MLSEGTKEVISLFCDAAEFCDVCMLFCCRKDCLLNEVKPTASVTTVGLISVTEDRTVFVPEYRVM